MTAKIEMLLSGELQPTPISREEELRRVREQITALSDRVFEAAEYSYPGIESYLRKLIARAEDLERAAA